jgi:hypothetical protein
MAPIVTLPPTHNQKSDFGNSKPMPVYIQLVPGKVIEAVTSKDSAAYNVQRDLNSIIAKSHIKSDDVNIDSTITERYYPLMRGTNETPVKGDPVLLTNIAGVNYYFGVLNTSNNANFNIDHIDTFNKKMSSGQSGKPTNRDKLGLSKNYKMSNLVRFQKLYNDELDNPTGNKKAKNDIHGDMMFEGRHGNCIRIGSRNEEDLIFISNGQPPSNIVETTSVGSLFAVIESGTLHQHFKWNQKVDDDNIVYEPFVISSDNESLENKRPMGHEVYNYDYNTNQILITSDKLTFNSRSDNIFLSSFNDIHIGTGNKLTINTNKETIIEASNIYLGKQALGQTEPVVLGRTLVDILTNMIDAIGEIFVGGTVGGVSIPVSKSNSPGWITPQTGLNSIKSKLETMLSEYHYIEDNGQKPD